MAKEKRCKGDIDRRVCVRVCVCERACVEIQYVQEERERSRSTSLYCA